MGVGVYIIQISSMEACALHRSPKCSSGIKLQSPTVETGLSMRLPLYYFPCILPVFLELSEQLAFRLLSQGSASGGTQAKTCSNSAPTLSLPLLRIPEKGKYSMCKKQQLNGKKVLLFE